ncbi:GntR family transcriptional regulator [Microbacterium soli]|uniref:GntR family transcriptional regulator n=1 Tax=Microbacterium soli TaxID=446075 RepID=A0ABP7N3U8_9MICO
MSLTDDVYDRLRDQILRVERRPGDVIYEADLAEEFGVSKTPVREALRLLAHSGWVVVLPRKGYLIRPVELRDVRDIFAIRRMIEPTLAEEAARSATGAQIASLTRLLDDHSTATALDVALLAAREFHLALAEISGSRRVHAMLEGLVDEVRRLHHLLPHIETRITSQQEIDAHRAILGALTEHDPERARALTLEHLNDVAHMLVRGFAGL